MKWTEWIIILCVLALSGHTPPLQAKRVVHMPGPIVSHVKFHLTLARELGSLGHRVWVAVPDFLLDKGFLDISNVTTLPYTMSENYLETFPEEYINPILSGAPLDINDNIAIALKICDDVMRNKALEQMVRDAKPDLIVLESLPIFYTLAVLPYKLQVPFAMAGTVYDVHFMRIPYSSAVNVLQLGLTFGDMTFLERVKNMFTHAMLFFHSPFMPTDAASIYAPDRPYISNSELLAQAEFWVLDMDHILDIPRPTLPNVKLIGGIMTGPAKPLPPRLQAFMDGATDGAVIVTFGSVLLGVPKHISDKLLEVFQKLPFRVVFRSNLTSPDPAKVFTSQWVPQNDLLGHPNTKIFVSHCGKNGQYEALFHAVPLLCTPIFAEQKYNSERIRFKGFGEFVDLRTVTHEELLSQIIKVAQEPRYKRAMTKASTLFHLQNAGNPLHEAAKWLDHVVEYGGEYMRYEGQNIPLYQFLGLDVLAFVLALGVACCVLAYCCLKMACTGCVRKLKSD